MKKIVALLLALLLAFGLVACGGGETVESKAPSSEAPASEAPAAPEAITLKV